MGNVLEKSGSYSQRQSLSLCMVDGMGNRDLMVFSPKVPPPPGTVVKEMQLESPALLDMVSGSPFLASRPLVLVAVVSRLWSGAVVSRAEPPCPGGGEGVLVDA